MNFLDLAGGLASELSLDASYAGLAFQFLSVQTNDGRRVQHQNLPGQDSISFQDLGQLDGEMIITGLLAGDDAPHQAERLRDKCRTPGPATLDVPFLNGVVQVICIRPVQITLTTEEIRIARFTLTVMRYLPKQPSLLDTLQGIFDAIADLKTAVRGMLRIVLTPYGIAVRAVAFVAGFVQSAQSTWSFLTGGARERQIQIAAAAPVAALTTAAALPVNASYPDAITNLLAAPSAAIAGVAIPTIPAAVGSGNPATAPSPADGRVTALFLLAAAARLAPADVTMPGAPLAVAAMALALADAVNVAADIPFGSQQEALAWQLRLASAIDAAAAVSARAATVNPVPIGPVWRGLIALGSAVAADMTATIGRLPEVRVFTPPSRAPVWVLAHFLAGDQPQKMLATYRDLVTRNKIPNPGSAPDGPLEVLR